ncbi:hypothetical protein D1007_33058 [Hordeum vulgare]|uniref:DUF4220 domain-containing protein n=1 Tax=Hordeum vulgare subsp. vulgare TaxID=112509 RepID=A0A8I7B1V8_HORVV|nr:hypothetical protein D1007_33058 [Hordeum vulgare]
MALGPLDLWNHWSIQILVLFSLTLQVFLSVFASIRRRGANPLLRILLWLAYMLADSTAIYALGHLSLSRSSKEHGQEQLVAFWAPFLLLHLGGPDNITAYALQDNQLWLRHLQILVVQVLGAGYVLYKRIADNGFFVMLASIQMFAIGCLKYAERTWALRCGNMDTIRSSLKNEPQVEHHQFHALDQRLREGGTNEEELYVRRAHSMFHVCKRAIVDSWIDKELENNGAKMLRDIRNEDYKGMWTLIEVELSLLYDILYTKAAVIHTWPGYCIRVVSPLAAVASFLLFHLSVKDSHSRVDIAITYTLLSGAFLLEMTSLLIAIGSSWTYTFLCTTRWNWLRSSALGTGRWDQLRQLAKKITRRQGGQARRWSGQMGQYNMVHFCSRHDTAFSPLLGRLAKLLGQKEWWNRKHYSGKIQISDELRRWLHWYIERLPRKNKVNTQGIVRTSWGIAALQSYNCYDVFKDYLGVELQEGIIIWHIATDAFLATSIRSKPDDADQEQVVKTIRILSNYMMFLLVERPDMLPGLAQMRLYQQTCQNLVHMWCNPNTSSCSCPPKNICTMLKELFSLRDNPNTSRLSERDKLAIRLYNKKPRYSTDVPRLYYVYKLTEALLKRETEKGSVVVLELVRHVWTDFLIYTANRCSRESHAKKLSSGAELTTILWLMADYFHKHSGLNAPEDV